MKSYKYELNVMATINSCAGYWIEPEQHGTSKEISKEMYDAIKERERELNGDKYLRRDRKYISPLDHQDNPLISEIIAENDKRHYLNRSHVDNVEVYIERRPLVIS